MALISIPGYAVIVSPPSEPVGTPITAATTITEPGDYYVANDFTATGTAITIDASNVTIDLNWKTVSFGSANASDVYGVHSSASSTQRNNIIVKNGSIKHAGTGLNCIGLTVFGTTYSLFNLAIDSNAGLFTGIGSKENYYSVKGVEIYNCYLQSRGDYSSGYAADGGIFLEDRSSSGYTSIHNNIVAESNGGIELQNFGLDVFPATASIIYQNRVQTNRQKYAKSPYCCSFGRSKNAQVYYNRFSAYNGRGITADGYGSGQTDGSTYINIHNNAIGANYLTPDKTYDPGGVQEYNNNYGIRSRYGSHNLTCNNNNIIVSNQLSGSYGYCVYIGEDFLADQANTHTISFDSNTLIANDGNVASPFASYAWGALDDVTITDTSWQQEADDVYERFVWITDDPGNETGDHRASVTETGTTVYAPTPTTPTAPTGLTITKFFDSYLLTWAENTEEDVWQYKIYKDGIAISSPIYSSRSPHTSVPDPFYVDVEETGSVSYTVTALTLTGTESVESSPILTSAAANGWQ